MRSRAEENGHDSQTETGRPEITQDVLASVQSPDAEPGEVHQGGRQDLATRVPPHQIGRMAVPRSRRTDTDLVGRGPRGEGGVGHWKWISLHPPV